MKKESVHKIRLNRLAVAISVSPLFFAPFSAFAIEGGAHHEAGVSSLFLPAVNFTLYVFLMYKILKRPISTALRARRENLESHIKRAAMHWDQARKQLLEVQRRFHSLDGNIKELSERISQDGKRESLTLLSDAKERAEIIIKRAKEGAEAERKSAEGQIRAELAQAVVRVASEKLAQDMTAESDRPLRERALDGIQAIG